MPVTIDKISVKNLGPLTSFEHEFGKLNVIYSPNEHGKTYLTEFILRALFRNQKRWNTIRKGGQGKIWVSGLEDQALTFSPSSKRKLEDFWQEQEYGLPASISNILMAKGSEASISSDGINKELIKEVLSGINVLDNIDSKIPKTVQGASLGSGNISIKQQGEGKKLDELRSTLQQYENLSEEIETDYTLGISEDYSQKLAHVEKQLHLVNKAKKYKAWQISQELNRIKEEGLRYPEKEISQLQQDISLHQNTKNDYAAKEEKYEKAAQKSQDIEWLRSARENYREWTINQSFQVKPLYYILTGIVALAALIFILFNLKIPAVIAFLATLGGLGFILNKLYGFTKEYGKHREIHKLKDVFENTFGKELTDIAVLEEELEKQNKYAEEASFIRKELESLDQKLNGLRNNIEQRFNTLTGEKPAEKEWEQKLNEIRQIRKDLEDKYNEKNRQLARLDVNESDFITEDPGITYSKEQYDKYKQTYEELKQKLESNEINLRNLKKRICDVTRDDLHTPWDQLLENFRIKKEEKEEDLKNVTARIAAGIIVHNRIEDFRKQEDQKIQDGLASEAVTKPLYELTKRYDSLTLNGDELKVSDNFGEYNLSELSTGAREQVMLALRIGFGQKLLKKDTLFLILDDTFQHSDWKKREMLVEKLAEIAEKGWQVIYFTMDDHIYDLFAKKGDRLGDQFKRIELHKKRAGA